MAQLKAQTSVEEIGPGLGTLATLCLECHLLEQALHILWLQKVRGCRRSVPEDAERALAVRGEKRTTFQTLMINRSVPILFYSILEVLKGRVILQGIANIEEAFDLVVDENLEVREHVFKDSLFRKLFRQHFNETIAMDYLDGWVSADQMRKMYN